MIYVRVVKSNALNPEDVEYMVQVSETGLNDTWVQASHWLASEHEAQELALGIIRELEKQAIRQSISVVSTYSGDTQ